MPKQGEVLTLDDNKTYSVVSSKIINDISYVYLIDQNDYTNVMFCKYDTEELIEITDDHQVEKLMISFHKELHKN